MEWTPAQERAISIDNKNLLVSAAAGSGKTSVLTERIVRLVKDGAEISRFLVVTFTDAAANEMKQRITKRLYDAANNEANAELSSRLREQALAVGRANISTIHSFCLYILRRNFHKLGLDPSFSTADEILSAIAFREALLNTSETMYERDDEGFRALLSAFNGNEDELFAQAKNLHSFLMARPNPWSWLNNSVGQYKDGGAVTRALAQKETLRSESILVSRLINRLMLLRQGVPREYPEALRVLDDDMSKLRPIANSGDIDVFRERLADIKFGIMKWPKDADANIKTHTQRERDRVKEEIRKKQKLFAATEAEEEALMLEMAPAIEAFAGFVHMVDDEYAAIKRQRAKVDFSDMEHLALKALDDEEIQSALMHRFDYIFVDEYQDSSLIQERILSRVCRESNLFLVGDVKQSIYRFRQAEPALFLQKLKEYDDFETGEAIHLNVNHRSEQPVIDAVNDVFSRIMSEKAGELDYDDNAALKRVSTSEPSGLAGVEFHLIDKTLDLGDAYEGDENFEEDSLDTDIFNDTEANEPADPIDDEDEKTLAAAKAEARFAAKRILELMADHTYIEKGMERPLRYSDFAVLSRAYRRTAQVWATELSRAGVPAYVQLTGGYFDAIEVQIFLNLLRIIDNRRQDIPLASVLRSPIFGFDEEAFIELRTQYPFDTLFESLSACAKADTPLSEKARTVFLELARWRRESLLLPLNDFAAKLLDECGLYECMGALSNGRERQLNLDALTEQARGYVDAGGACDLYSFLRYMDSAKSTASMGAAQPGANDVVRVLSIHKSKGLEFPVVILAGIASTFNKNDRNSKLLFDSELGIGAKLVINKAERNTLIRRAISASQTRKNVAEEMRILYVGMTRARSRLILIASLKDAKKRQSEAKTVELTPAHCSCATSFLDWLLPVAADTCTSLNLSIHGPAEWTTTKAVPDTADDEKVRELAANIAERFSWRYPYQDSVDIPSKLSVSELLSTGRETTLRDAPAFAREGKPLTSAQTGAAVHLFLKEASYNFAIDSHEHVKHELERLTEKGVISKAQVKAISESCLDDIAWFLSSDMNTRRVKSRQVERELEFSIELPANTLIDTKSAEPILLQGVMDCCFVEGGKWILLDFKTDRVKNDADEEAKTHAPQLALYARALEKLTGMSVSKRYVVMLRARRIVEVK